MPQNPKDQQAPDLAAAIADLAEVVAEAEYYFTDLAREALKEAQ